MVKKTPQEASEGICICRVFRSVSTSHLEVVSTRFLKEAPSNEFTKHSHNLLHLALILADDAERGLFSTVIEGVASRNEESADNQELEKLVLILAEV